MRLCLYLIPSTVLVERAKTESVLRSRLQPLNTLSCSQSCGWLATQRRSYYKQLWSGTFNGCRVSERLSYDAAWKKKKKKAMPQYEQHLCDITVDVKKPADTR